MAYTPYLGKCDSWSDRKMACAAPSSPPLFSRWRSRFFSLFSLSPRALSLSLYLSLHLPLSLFFSDSLSVSVSLFFPPSLSFPLSPSLSLTHSLSRDLSLSLVLSFSPVSLSLSFFSLSQLILSRCPAFTKNTQHSFPSCSRFHSWWRCFFFISSFLSLQVLKAP